MKLLIFSDSHGNVANMEDVVRMERPDRILHLGDLVRDAQALQEKFPQIPVLFVPGNCDGRRPDLPDQRVFTLEGCKLLMTHGHIYHVKMGTAAAIGLPPHGTRSRHGPKGGRGDPNGGTTP